MAIEEVIMTGAQLIAQERDEQINKHGFEIQHDDNYEDGELIEAALATIYGNIHEFPESWMNSPHLRKICNKDIKDRLVIAGALIAAEIDRLYRMPKA